jgi:magnesium-transporting ATPase (P-type)
MRYGRTADSGFALDTTFVLFFLAVDFGQTMNFFAFGGILSLITLAMLTVFPYFLQHNGERPEFGNWVFGRVLIAAFAVALGLAFRQSLGVLLPDVFKFVPMTLLIVAGMLSFYIQFYGMMKFRLAR